MAAAAVVAQQYGRPPPRLLVATLMPIALLLILQPLMPALLPDAVVRQFGVALPKQPTYPALQVNLGFGILAFVGAVQIIPVVSESFSEKGLQGRDLLKPGGRTSGPWVPECMGLPCAALYIGLMMLFIPFPFSQIFANTAGGAVEREVFSIGDLALYLSALLSLFTATLLGFIDDLFDIRWRHKLPIPLIAAVPTLVVYYTEGGLTSVVLPRALGAWLNKAGLIGWVGSKVINLGPLYYLYLILVPTFTTNAINILAGINGVEGIQAFVIALSIALNDLLFLPIWPRWLLMALGELGNPHEGRVLEWAAGEVVKRHMMSFYFMVPMVGVCAGFLWHNWYPARAFPGDTFCYFSGMAFSAVALQGHFSKTLILFFIPQIFNFVLSCPQLFRLVECPRHRLPAYEAETGLLHPSKAEFTAPPPLKTRLVLNILEPLRLVRLERIPYRRADGSAHPQGGQILSTTNLTILNFLLVTFGPMREQSLCLLLGVVQVAGSAIAFFIRYGLGAWVYGGDRR